MPPISAETALERRLTDWWDNRTALYEKFLGLAKSKGLPGGRDLWDGMPEIDSKAVAETSVIFEEVLGIPLDFKLVKIGGYDQLDDMKRDLISPMIARAAGQAPVTVKNN